MLPLHQSILNKVERCYQRAESFFQRPFPQPEVSFDQRGKIAGSARLQLNQLRFNPKLLEDNIEEFIEHVVPHEVSHLIAYQLYGRVKPHGREWQNIMQQVFNVPARITHSMNVEKVQGKTFSYQCLCGPVQLSIRRHNSAQKGRQYQCRACGSLLSWTEGAG